MLDCHQNCREDNLERIKEGLGIFMLAFQGLVTSKHGVKVEGKGLKEGRSNVRKAEVGAVNRIVNRISFELIIEQTVSEIKFVRLFQGCKGSLMGSCKFERSEMSWHDLQTLSPLIQFSHSQLASIVNIMALHSDANSSLCRLQQRIINH